MKKNNLLLISFLIFLSALCNMTAQTIRGKVVNDADLTLADVRIYLDGTQTGTVSAADGSFTLDLTGKSPANLVFRKEDYETLITPAPGALNKTLKVVLLKSNDIEEVRLVPYTEEAYRNYITYFLDQFIGTDHEHVRIKNQRTLKFAYDKTNKTLTVKAPQTLLIENKNLGYEIAYTIVDFFADFNTRMVRNTGTSFFRKTKDTDRIKLNRRNAYDGSL
ncbi:carboxypeptidase-like regulatory domain-containing protein, partial [uncultured Chryseobacterium sp.]|uniref:carboxypeptidase-like regulatory domain-containing protein n=1 Tax=uncultured Chryseobacterium sp. TaxID=259322 RepID=UPI00345BC9D9